MLGTSCKTTSFFEQGDFGPCPKETPEENKAIRSLGNHEDTKAASALLGRVAKFCKAYHVRIGYIKSE